MNKQFKSLEFIYQDVEIHFLVNSYDTNVMVNATEMAKAFGKEIDNFLRLAGTKDFIKELIESENLKNKPSDVRGYLTEKDVVDGRKRGGTFMHRKLALKFATWLDVKFELWIIETIDSILFGNYKKHWEAHARQEFAKQKMEEYKREILLNPSPEKVAQYFSFEKDYQNAKNDKTKAIQNQLKLFVD